MTRRPHPPHTPSRGEHLIRSVEPLPVPALERAHDQAVAQYFTRHPPQCFRHVEVEEHPRLHRRPPGLPQALRPEPTTTIAHRWGLPGAAYGIRFPAGEYGHQSEGEHHEDAGVGGYWDPSPSAVCAHSIDARSVEPNKDQAI